MERKTETAAWQEACAINTEAAYRKYLRGFPSGNHRDEAWRKVNKCGHSPSPANEGDECSQDDESKLKNDLWECVDKSDIEALRNFCRNHPESPHREDAMRLLNSLKADNRKTGVQRIEEIIEGNTPDDVPAAISRLFSRRQAKEDDLIEVFKNDNNILPPDLVAQLSNVLEFSRLSEAAIDEKFIHELEEGAQITMAPLNTSVYPLESIPDGFTEIYFWGVPSSGKTCAVGSIMSAMTEGFGVKSGIPDPSSQGAAYMMPLAARFHEGEICVLPPRTKVEETFEMRYVITDDNGKEHNLAFIDLSGELFECMHRSQAKLPLTDQQNSAIQVLENILVENKSTNPKLHFFVIEYGTEDKIYMGLRQNDLLLSGLSYLDAKNILRDNTIGVYIIITKADKAGDNDIGAYVDKHYGGFYKGLQDRMKRRELNTRGGKAQVKRFPFSIGKVCFKTWCLYDREWTAHIIKEIKERSYGTETGRLGGIIRGMRK